MPIQLEFVPENGPTKPKGADRSLIRSRSMMGRNKREGSRRSIRQKKMLAGAEGQISCCSRIPAPPPTDLALVRFASDVGPRAQELLYSLITSNATHFSVMPLEKCVDFDFARSHEFARLFHDISFLSAAIFTSSAINDLALPTQRQPSLESARYLSQTLSILNTKLYQNNAYRTDSTIVVVITLALLSAAFDDWTAVSAHLTGLHRVVELCGGLDFLRQRSKLYYKIERIDLLYALSMGRRPYFSPDLIGWDRTFKSRPLLLARRLRTHNTHGFKNERLAIVFEDLQYLAITINENAREHARWKGDAFQKASSSIQARLLHLMTELKEPLQEFVCLGMLALLTTSFQIPGRRIAYTHLANRFRGTCLMLAAGPLRADLETLWLWGLLIGAISVFDLEEEVWLLEKGGALFRDNSIEWEHAEARIRTVMWIDCIHSAPGKRVFETMKNTAPSLSQNGKKKVSASIYDS